MNVKFSRQPLVTKVNSNLTRRVVKQLLSLLWLSLVIVKLFQDAVFKESGWVSWLLSFEKLNFIYEVAKLDKLHSYLNTYKQNK